MQDRNERLLEFLQRSGPQLYALLTRLTLRQDIAEDLMQELFIKLSNSKSFEGAENKNAFACRTAINLACDWRKKRNPSLLPSHMPDQPAPDTASPLDKLIEKENLDHVLTAAGKLSELTRQAFIMRYIQQHSCERIAEMLGKKPPHIRMLCSRALALLRDLLGPTKSGPTEKEAADV